MMKQPAMRPSAALLLQHERLDLKKYVPSLPKRSVPEIMARLMAHKAAMINEERGLLKLEAALLKGKNSLIVV